MSANPGNREWVQIVVEAKQSKFHIIYRPVPVERAKDIWDAMIEDHRKTGATVYAPSFGYFFVSDGGGRKLIEGNAQPIPMKELIEKGKPYIDGTIGIIVATDKTDIESPVFKMFEGVAGFKYQFVQNNSEGEQ